jgi:hypothetical protein
MVYLTYGVIGGAGLGLGYIVPVATLVRWFPDKRGMITGVAVAGFGAGALITAPQRLIASVGVSSTFVILGIAYFTIIMLSATVMRNPPEGYVPTGFNPSSTRSRGSSAQDFALRQALRTWQWYGLWLTLFLNSAAGIAIISQASPMAQEISRVNASTAAGLVGIISIANGSGRFVWAWFSDAIASARAESSDLTIEGSPNGRAHMLVESTSCLHKPAQRDPDPTPILLPASGCHPLAARSPRFRRDLGCPLVASSNSDGLVLASRSVRIRLGDREELTSRGVASALLSVAGAEDDSFHMGLPTCTSSTRGRQFPVTASPLR